MRIAWIVILVLPWRALAQTDAVIQGRITDTDGVGIGNAIVDLAGLRSTQTSAAGAFRFANVALGQYTLRVTAIGYAPVSRVVIIEADTAITVVMEEAPLELDPLIVVAPREIDLEGRVRDPEKDLSLMGAEVLSSEGHLARTNTQGRFSLDVFEGVGVLVGVRAFGYYPLDTLIEPRDDYDYEFDLTVDPLVTRMIEVEIERLEDRAGGHRAITMRPMNRDDLVRWKDWTVLDLLQARYPQRIRRLDCVIIDEREVFGMMAGGILQTTMAKEVERIEFLFRGAMLRLYTQDFMRTMIGGGIELRQPTYVSIPNGRPICG